MSTNQNSAENRWLIFELCQQHYALPALQVREMVAMQGQHIRAVPQAAAYVPGVVNLRNQVIPVIDMRRLLNLPSVDDESASIIEELHQREEDHINWLNELEACVDEQRTFRLATDPHLCKFGKWYDKTRSCESSRRRFTKGRYAMQALLDAFDAPHKAIHAIAQKVTACVQRKAIDDAKSIINATRDTDLKAMRELFDSARRILADSVDTVMIVIEHETRVAGLMVDHMETVVDIDEDRITKEMTVLRSCPYLMGLAQVDQFNGTVLLANPATILQAIDGQCGSLQAA